MAFRFVHTTDIHHASPLRTLALREPALVELIPMHVVSFAGELVSVDCASPPCLST
jgi:hypothetical protein